MLPKLFWNPPQGVDHGKAKNIRVSGRFFFCDVKIDAIARFGLWMRHEKWCHTADIRVIMLSRLRNGANFLTGSSRGSDSEPDFIRKLLSPPYRNLRASKTTFFSRFLENLWSVVLAGNGSSFSLISSQPPTATWGAKKRHRFSKNLPLLLYRTVLKKKVNTRMKLFPSTPVPQHPRPKSKHRIEKLFSTT